ncbi:hypothetical protein [Candidatus Poriferisodalis sp.]|uniref:hypothetical protein n=1 Tax=Candidatus Poriferisodalis sp. TaxID=3101277 RepID=UPI003B02415A
MTDTQIDRGIPGASDSTPEPTNSASDCCPDATQALPSPDPDHHGDDSINAAIDRVKDRLNRWPGISEDSAENLERLGGQFLECLVMSTGDSWQATTGEMFDWFHAGGFTHPTTGRKLATARGSRSVRG